MWKRSNNGKKGCTNDTKDGMTVKTAIALQKDDAKFLEEMDRYIEQLKSRPPQVAKKEAREALYRTGVIDQNGKLKENIVSWE